MRVNQRDATALRWFRMVADAVLDRWVSAASNLKFSCGVMCTSGCWPAVRGVHSLVACMRGDMAIFSEDLGLSIDCTCNVVSEKKR
jgi:hypothetical protein